MSENQAAGTANLNVSDGGHPSQNSPIKVDIWSDIACPWCYIGKRKFEAGVEQFGGEVSVEYHSFELAPDTPTDFEGSEVEFLAKHKGMDPEQVTQMLNHVTQVAKNVGLDYDFDALKHANTVKAHELIHFAKANGKQIEMKERLLAAYFVEGKNVGSVEELVALAEEVGLDAGEAREALSTERYLPAVRADQQRAQTFGIRGVPFFVIDGKYGVSGAQESATFAAALQQVLEEREAA